MEGIDNLTAGLLSAGVSCTVVLLCMIVFWWDNRSTEKRVKEFFKV